MTGSEIITFLDIKHKHNWFKVYDAILHKEILDFEDENILKTIEQYKEKGFKIITILDKEYPDAFKACIRPPFVIYCKGKLSILNKAVKKKEYIYLDGPNKFKLDPKSYFTYAYNTIRFDKDLIIKAGFRNSILTIIPALTKTAICSRVIVDKSDIFLGLLQMFLSSPTLDFKTYVVPTLEDSINIELVNDGMAYLITSKECLK